MTPDQVTPTTTHTTATFHLASCSNVLPCLSAACLATYSAMMRMRVLFVLCAVTALLMLPSECAAKRRKGRRNGEILVSRGSSSEWDCRDEDLQSYLDGTSNSLRRLSVIECERAGRNQLRCLVAYKSDPVGAALNTLHMKCKKGWKFFKQYGPRAPPPPPACRYDYWETNEQGDTTPVFTTSADVERLRLLVLPKFLTSPVAIIVYGMLVLCCCCYSWLLWLCCFCSLG